MPYKDIRVYREYQRNYQIEWNKKNPQKRRDISMRCDDKRKNNPTRIENKHTARQRKLIRNKITVFEMYGKECRYCGESRFELLCIDHINGIGTLQRRAESRGGNIYEWLVLQPYQPEKYQVLCHNCNMAKTFFNIQPGDSDYMPWDYWREFSKKRR